MTEALYHSDAYLKAFSATVVSEDGDGVVLDRTAFFPGGGGQPADLGTIWQGGASFSVHGVRRGTSGPIHLIEGVRPRVGEAIEGEIEWPRRHALMRAHTALHVLCGIIFRDYGASVTGASMDVGSARMDFDLERLEADFVARVQERMTEEIAAARPVQVRFLPRAEAFAIPDLIRTKVNLLPEGIETIRIVDIVGLDLQADGGTHVANTAHVGHARIAGYESKGRNNKRLRLTIE
ncbi:MAG: alanyl-tRNA editing protein [Chloroflexi bacterium]|nr:alanyl-tRNA editing protein [Chloroflexota bacterium]